ncbi:putative 2-aminoethylphosphonate ABC transporter substrate-binding protein [Cupriavidus gilardii]|uniref:putative 2-aminoethylphosphonate ABC transporter substrate-binding protein n=1 Tax=Cupriavidus gilardii TaxID=82541 RepID=UPI0018E6770F|nr:putative 2-aminoethylphosphonate ABC transporter substrate-binding protein [Cupriavidus gilardii]MCT9115800.1 putative 2-aminoethylphosphonate ABC transporter substrate-binding protein [Cupriavidus gilardii]MCT9124370.1 putative 2-aminoethylphosphonate ABC transporter substrate-binding protein [Cupriavidus gilardii]QQE08734.1 putative 2-aminoethylphosphonate ABC transporter substrate-binding protein [Cupriavidus sp. ISTL7]
MTLAKQALAATAALVLSGAAFAQKTTLTVYTAWEIETLKPYAEGFAKVAPDIELKYVRDSTGVITAKALAEKANPQADVIAGLAASSLELLKQEGMLQPYSPKGFERLTRDYSDKATPPSWVGLDVWGATVCFNTIEAKKRNLPRPETWRDLAKPIYKGMIVMPNPVSSGTGFLDVTAWLQLFGEQEGWKYMDALHENIAQYTHSGSKPCKQAGAGEFPIGISFELRAHKTKAAGAPIDIIFPREGLGYDIEAAAIVKGTRKQEAAQRYLDWLASREANELFARDWAIVAYPGVARKIETIPAGYEKMLVKNDFGYIAKHRERVLTEWQKRYSAKAEKQ